MLRLVISSLAVCLLTAAITQPAAAARRVALLVGIKSYAQSDVFHELKNAERDVVEIGRRLKTNQGFDEVHTLLSSKPNQTGHYDILDKWARIVSSLKEGDLVLFYFAGHAIELRGRNYLQPQDANVKGRNALEVGNITTTSIDFRDLLDKLAYYQESKKLFGVFVLDACRENPIKGRYQDAADLRTVGLLSEPKLPRDVFVLYSAGVGQSAWDGEPDTNSPFAAELIELLKATDLKPKLSSWSLTKIAEHLRVKVRDRVRRVGASRTVAGGRAKEIVQTPSYYSQLRDGRRFDGTRTKPQHLTHDNKSFPVEVNTLGPRDSFSECAFCPVMIVVPSGDGPAKTKSGKYAIGKFEVTRREWARCVEEKACSDGLLSGILRPDTPANSSHPVTNVSWNDAQDFTRWLSTKTKATYGLPSDAQWLHAARAGVETAYVFGNKESDEALCQYANGADREIGVLARQYAHCSDRVGRGTAPVGAYRANEFGLHDVHGNVWEWVSDCWPPQAVPATDTGDRHCSLRIARGGSWASGAAALSFKTRNRFPSGHDRQTLGFRVMRTID